MVFSWDGIKAILPAHGIVQYVRFSRPQFCHAPFLLTATQLERSF
jgi:hypothetical protein